MAQLPEQEEEMEVEIEETEQVQKVSKAYNYEPTGFVAY